MGFVSSDAIGLLTTNSLLCSRTCAQYMCCQTVYTYMSLSVYMYVSHIYICIQRKRDRERERGSCLNMLKVSWPSSTPHFPCLHENTTNRMLLSVGRGPKCPNVSIFSLNLPLISVHVKGSCHISRNGLITKP